jgi:hypothetical protein
VLRKLGFVKSVKVLVGHLRVKDGKSPQRSNEESPEEVDQVMVIGLEEYTCVVGGLMVKAKARGRARRIAL